MKKIVLLILIAILMGNIIAKTSKNKSVVKKPIITYDYLKKAFPKHLIVKLEKKYHLYLPNKNNMNGNLIFNINNKDIFDNSYKILKDKVVFPTSDTIFYQYLQNQEIDLIAPQISTLLYTVKCLGTPFYSEIKFNSKSETYLIHYVQNNKVKKEYTSFRPVFDFFHDKWKNHNIYLRLNDIKKSNGHLEFSLNAMSVDPSTLKKDFVDMRVHFSKNNDIDLVMFFWYEDIEE